MCLNPPLTTAPKKAVKCLKYVSLCAAAAAATATAAAAAAAAALHGVRRKCVGGMHGFGFFSLGYVYRWCVDLSC